MKFVCMKVEYAQLTRSVVAFKDIWKNKKLSLMIASYIVDVVLFKILSKWGNSPMRDFPTVLVHKLLKVDVYLALSVLLIQ